MCVCVCVCVCVFSTLSQVLHAVTALLYPFVWQHTFISIVPTVLIDVCAAPTPYLLGVQKSLLEELTDHSDVSHTHSLTHTHTHTHILAFVVYGDSP